MAISGIIPGSAIRFAGDVSLTNLTLRRASGGKTIKLDHVFVELNLYEDLFSPFLAGNLVIADSMNLPSNFPIDGEEVLEIEFSTPTYEGVRGEFTILSLKDRALDGEKERSQHYVLNFISSEAYLNARTIVSEGISDKPSHKVVAKLLKDYMNISDESTGAGSKKLVLNEEGVKPVFAVIPSWTPFRTINWIAANKADSKKTPKAANFIFAERVDGFIFTSIETLMQESPVETYIFQPASLAPNASTIQERMSAIMEYAVDKQFEHMDNFLRGMYGSTLHVFDIIKQTRTPVVFSYDKTFPSHKHLDKTKIATDTSGQIGFQEDLAKDSVWRSIVHHPKAFEREQPETYNPLQPSKLQERISAMQQLEVMKMRVIVPGNSTRRVGQVVFVDIPSPQPMTDTYITDKRLTGNWMIGAIRHRVTNDDYSLHIDLFKDSVKSLSNLGGISGEDPNAPS